MSNYSGTRSVWPGLRLTAFWWCCLSLAAAEVCAQGANSAKPNNLPAPTPTMALGLEECLQIGLANQPALAAAQASLSSAEIGRRSLDNLGKLAEWIRKDLPIRRQQANLGIVIASAGLEQAYWETRYAVIRNFYSYQYAHLQDKVAQEALKRLQKAKDFLVEKEKQGEDVRTIDIDKIDVNIHIVKAKRMEAVKGIDKAAAALREAMGVAGEQVFPIAQVGLPPVDEKVSPTRAELLDLALRRRGELVQAVTANQITCLEIAAQDRINKLKGETFAAGGDIHSRPIPAAMFNDIYRPGALGLEMPTQLVGKRPDRVDRAHAFHERTGAVVDKTQNLVILEVEVALAKYEETREQLLLLRGLPEKTQKIVEDTQRRLLKQATTEQAMFANILDLQTQIQYNEALYRHALSLAGLERVTAGGFPLPGVPLHP